jgi:hypothetical protein
MNIFEGVAILLQILTLKKHHKLDNGYVCFGPNNVIAPFGPINFQKFAFI